MELPSPLLNGWLVSRYKRFFADVTLSSGETVTAHVPNTGAMTGLSAPGMKVWLSPAGNPARRLRYTLEFVEVDGKLVGVNTQHPNRIAAEAIAAGAVSELSGYSAIRREVRYDDGCRVDLHLGEHPNRACAWVEVKNVHLLRRPGLAEFPDSRTARGLKHLGALVRRVQAGDRAAMLFVVQRADAKSFAVADDIDPDYAAGLRDAAAQGVEVLCYGCHLTISSLRLHRRLEWVGSLARAP